VIGLLQTGKAMATTAAAQPVLMSVRMLVVVIRLMRDNATGGEAML
jgi:hypothetical protein